KNALTAVRETMAQDTARNASAFLDRIEDLNQKLIAERKRADRHEEALKTGARLDQYGEPSYPRAGYDRDTLEYKTFMHWLSKGRVTEFHLRKEKGTVVQTWSPSDLDLKTLRTDSATAGGY